MRIQINLASLLHVQNIRLTSYALAYDPVDLITHAATSVSLFCSLLAFAFGLCKPHGLLDYLVRYLSRSLHEEVVEFVKLLSWN